LIEVLSPASLEVLHRFARSNVLLAFDFDGTLAPIGGDRTEARLRPPTSELLTALAELYPVAIVSGRARNDVLSRLGAARVAEVIGNHGLEPWPGQDQFAARVAGWLPLLGNELAGHEGVEIENKTFSLAIHYRHSRVPDLARQAIGDAAGRLESVRVVGGKMVVNLLPVGAPDKGVAVIAARDRLGCDTAVYVGDDDTDEDVFKLKDSRSLLTVRIEPSPSSEAEFYLRDQEAVDRLLGILIAARAGRGALGAL